MKFYSCQSNELIPKDSKFRVVNPILKLCYGSDTGSLNTKQNLPSTLYHLG